MRDNYNVTLKIKKDDKRLHMSKKSSTFAGYFGFLIYQKQQKKFYQPREFKRYLLLVEQIEMKCLSVLDQLQISMFKLLWNH